MEWLTLPINVERIRQLLAAKNEVIRIEQEELEKIFTERGGNLINILVDVIQEGGFTLSVLLDLLDQLKLDDEVLDALAASVSLLEHSKELSTALGFDVLLTKQMELQLQTLLEAYENKFRKMFRDEIADDLFIFAVESKLAGRNSDEIIRLAEERLSPLGRRAATEVGTALSAFDRSTMGAYYELAGVERYVYWGPDDDVNRETCQAALDSEKQHTGWTREEIDADPGVDFVLGGKPYYNCRHEWLPHGVISPEVA